MATVNTTPHPSPTGLHIMVAMETRTLPLGALAQIKPLDYPYTPGRIRNSQ